MNENEEIRSDLISLFSDNAFTLPNLLSLLRIILVIPFSYFFMNNNYAVAAAIMAASGISDFLDGFIARKFDMVSRLGKCLDPIADKITLFAVGICIVFIFPSLLPIVFILILKDVLMVLGACYLLKNGIAPPSAKWYGKIATVAFYLASIALVCMHIFNCVNTVITISAFSVTTLFMLYAIINYYKIFKSLLNDTSNLSEKYKV